MPVGRGGGARPRRRWRQGGCLPSTSLFAGCLTPLDPTHALYHVVFAYWWQPADNQVLYVCGQGMASGRRPHTTLPARRWMYGSQTGWFYHHTALRCSHMRVRATCVRRRQCCTICSRESAASRRRWRHRRRHRWRHHVCMAQRRSSLCLQPHVPCLRYISRQRAHISQGRSPP